MRAINIPLKLLLLATIPLLSVCGDALSADCWLGEHFTKLQNYSMRITQEGLSREQCLTACKVDLVSAGQICNRLGAAFEKSVEFGCFYKSDGSPIELLLQSPPDFYGCTEVCECPEGKWYEDFRQHCVEPTGMAVPQMPNGDKGGGYYAKDEYLFRATSKASCRTLPSGVPTFRTAGAETSDRWTAWMNLDRPGGNGDMEHLNSYIKVGKVCARPVEIQCRTTAGLSWLDAGQIYICNRSIGGICTNNTQAEGTKCLDYEVRFLCP